MKQILMGAFALMFIHLNAQTMSSPQEAVTRLFISTDLQNWEAVEESFATEVNLDYSSMNGQPAAKLSPEQITSAWKTILPGFESTHHQLGNFITSENEGHAHVYCYGTASHFLEHETGNLWLVAGTYDFDLQKDAQGKWKVASMVFNFKFQDGNTALPGAAIQQVNDSNKKSTTMKKVQFKSEGATLTGNLFMPANMEPSKTYPAIVVSGSWTTVKEQMAGLYAEKFAEEGFIALAFDFRNFGESEGEPRFYESPNLKKADIQSAVSFLETVPEVDATKIGAFGVCAGAMYTVMAASEDNRIKSVATAASWLHDAEAVKLFYGGEEGVQAKLDAARGAKKEYAEHGVVNYIPTISTEDPTAAMYGPYDYYLNPERGAISQWSNDKFAVMSWEDWLTADPMVTAPNLKQPILMIHSDGAVLPQYTKNYFNALGAEDKKLHWMETELESPFHQFNYYDQTEEVNESIEEASNWFKLKL